MKKEIILCTPEAATSKIMLLLLESMGRYEINVTEVRMCKDAIRKMKTKRYCLVITEKVTSDDTVNGFDVVREALAKGGGTKVLMLVSSFTNDDRERGKFLPPSGYLQKPLDPGLFKCVVDSLIRT
ncbi:MAG: hypothetical protein EXS59_00825 [Candidatus Taylorbacteria bacterium]|nr:hypothetical protein [Candidatus Taylorbacteria bacterium]